MTQSDPPVPPPIAVLGYAGRVSGAPDVDAWWRALCDGRDCIERWDGPADEWVRAGGIMPDSEGFDMALFGYSPAEASRIDPQQRWALQIAWAALEDAGHHTDPHADGPRIGVFAACSPNTYASQIDGGGEQTVQQRICDDVDFVATRIAYKLGLTGPAVTVASGCSSSLSALHLARLSLLAGDCEIAVVIGVSISFPERMPYEVVEGGILSPFGRCAPFDRDASGTVPGAGAIAVVLRPLGDASREGDVIRAVLRSTSLNNDGSSKVGFTAPSKSGQLDAIRRAQRAAAVPPGAIGFVEAHGTGTVLGDPIEIAALREAFAGVPGPCRLGSLKGNIGHLDAAAGIAGLLKVVLALERGVIPPTANFHQPAQRLALERTPFVIDTHAVPWPGAERFGAVSSFGMGGTNGHAVLSCAPPAERPRRTEGPVLLVVSAATPAARLAVEERLAEHLRDRGDDVRDVAFTLLAGRRRLRHRSFAVVEPGEDLRWSRVDGGGAALGLATVRVDPRLDVSAAAALAEQLAEMGLQPTSACGTDPDEALVIVRDERSALEAAGRWWSRGGRLDPLPTSYGRTASTPRRAVLPTYPFELRSCSARREPLPSPAPAAPTARDVDDAAAGIHAVFSELLGVTVSAGDDFFVLGGDSLLATQIVTVIKQRYGIQLDLETVFEHSEIGAFVTEALRRREPG
jgi:acyl transferase domain-containing protein